MNRRMFILSGSAGIALLATRAAAQRGTEPSSVIVSEVTGAEIDFSASGFTLEHQQLDTVIGGDGAAHDHEHIHFMFERGKLEIELLASGTYNWQDDMARFVDAYKREHVVEEHTYADLPDGGYAAFSFDTSAVYIEYQLGSFPDVDMRVILLSAKETFQANLERAQTILVGGTAPFLYMQDSKVADIVFPTTAQTTATRNTRSTRESSTNQSERTQTSASNTNARATEAPSEAEYVEIVVAQRQEFLGSYEQFIEYFVGALQQSIDEDQRSEYWKQTYEIALVWKAYSEEAAAHRAPAGLTELGRLYARWAEAIGNMGVVFEELYDGTNTVLNAFLAAEAEMHALDKELEAALKEYGVPGFSGASGAIESIRSGIRAVWRSIR